MIPVDSLDTAVRRSCKAEFNRRHFRIIPNSQYIPTFAPKLPNLVIDKGFPKVLI